MQRPRSVLGLAQLDILCFIRKMSLENKRVSMDDVREYGRVTMAMNNAQAQIDTTVKRLAEKGLVEMHTMAQVSYVNTLRNEKIVEENLMVCDRAIQHSR